MSKNKNRRPCIKIAEWGGIEFSDMSKTDGTILKEFIASLENKNCGLDL